MANFLSSSLYVACGGAAGAWARFAVGRLIGTSAFPWATLSVNLIGSFAMGLLAGWLVRSGPGGEPWLLLLGVGALGGLMAGLQLARVTA